MSFEQPTQKPNLETSKKKLPPGQADFKREIATATNFQDLYGSILKHMEHFRLKEHPRSMRMDPKTRKGFRDYAPKIYDARQLIDLIHEARLKGRIHDLPLSFGLRDKVAYLMREEVAEARGSIEQQRNVVKRIKLDYEMSKVTADDLTSDFEPEPTQVPEREQREQKKSMAEQRVSVSQLMKWWIENQAQNNFGRTFEKEVADSAPGEMSVEGFARFIDKQYGPDLHNRFIQDFNLFFKNSGLYQTTELSPEFSR